MQKSFSSEINSFLNLERVLPMNTTAMSSHHYHRVMVQHRTYTKCCPLQLRWTGTWQAPPPSSPPLSVCPSLHPLSLLLLPLLKLYFPLQRPHLHNLMAPPLLRPLGHWNGKSGKTAFLQFLFPDLQHLRVSKMFLFLSTFINAKKMN